MNCETLDWKEYQSKKYRFKLKYPKSLYPWESDGGRIIVFKKYASAFGNVVILCNEVAEKEMTSEDLFRQILRYIPKDRRISLKVLKISNETVDAIELIQHEVEVNPEYTKLISIEFFKDNLRFCVIWHGQDKEFLENTGLFYKMVDSFEFC